MYCKNCGNKIEENSKFCRDCGERIATNTAEEIDILKFSDKNNETIIISNTDIEKDNKKDENFGKKIFSGIGIGGAVIGGGILYLVFTVLRFLYIAFSGLSMVWLSIVLFQEGSIVLGLAVLIIGTPIAIGIASYLFLPLLFFSILTLIVWGVLSIFGFDVSFYGIWDILWLSIKVLVVGGMGFVGIYGFINSIKQKNTESFLKENWFYIILFFFLIWVFFINGNVNNKEDLSYETYLKEKETSSGIYNELDKQKAEEVSIETKKITTSSASNWTIYTSYEDSFSVLFPNKPQLIKGKPNELFKINYYTVQSEEFDLILSVKSLTPIAEDNHNKKDIDSILKIMLEQLLPDNGKVTSLEYGYNKNYRVLNYVILYDTDTIQKGQIVYTGEDIYTLGNIYVLMTFDDRENYNKEIYDKFVNSFKTL